MDAFTSSNLVPTTWAMNMSLFAERSANAAPWDFNFPMVFAWCASKVTH